jgi:hypothetical protein
MKFKIELRLKPLPQVREVHRQGEQVKVLRLVQAVMQKKVTANDQKVLRNERINLIKKADLNNGLKNLKVIRCQVLARMYV